MGGFRRIPVGPSWRPPAVAAVVASAIALALVACVPERDSPEKQIRDLVARGEQAAEKRDTGALAKLISDRYRNDEGQDKRTLLQFVSYLLMRNQSIHLFTRVPSIRFPQARRAEVTAYVATAGRPIDRADDLFGLSADLYRVDFSAEDEGEGDWKVVAATWRPAEMGDFE